MKTPYLNDLFRRLRQGWRWVVGPVCWHAAADPFRPRLDAPARQARLAGSADAADPILLAISVLELQAGTMRAFRRRRRQARQAGLGRRYSAGLDRHWPAAFWVFLDWCDDQIPLWAGYLNSKASAHARANVFTYEHILALAHHSRVDPALDRGAGQVIPYAALRPSGAGDSRGAGSSASCGTGAGGRRGGGLAACRLAACKVLY